MKTGLKHELSNVSVDSPQWHLRERKKKEEEEEKEGGKKREDEARKEFKAPTCWFTLQEIPKARGSSKTEPGTVI